MSKLPHWDMTAIYPSPDSERFKSDIATLDKLSSELVSMIDNGTPLKALIVLKDRADAILITLTAYAESMLSTDTENDVYLKAMGEAEDASVRYQRAEDSFLRAVAKRSDEFSDPALSPYMKYLDDILVENSHLMSPEEEALAAELSRSGSSAWERLMSTVTSTATIEGETLTELRMKAGARSRSVRKDAFEREVKLLSEHKQAVAAALNGVKGTVLTLERKRGWSDPLDRSLFSSSITHEILDSLLSVIRSSLPMFRDYFRTKAKLLSLDNLDFFDLFAPVGECHRTYAFEEARDIVISSFSAFSPAMGAFAENAFDKKWIDAAPGKGKAGGAYDVFFPTAGESRVFMNFDGTYDSVSTLAHELGHAFHDSVVRDLPPSLSTYPMTLAETASIFSEMIVFDHVLSSSDDSEALPVIEAFVQSASQVVADIYSRYLFEKSVFEERRRGEISADRLSELMTSAENEAYGDAVGIKHPYMWAVKAHYYSADFSYYNYPYAFGELFALSLYARRNEKDFFSVYKSVLRNTGMKSASECAAIAGADITACEFWQSGIDVIASYAERLKEWL